MAIREIVWTVADNGKTIHPTAPQDGGVQGEHNATRAVWRVGENSVWETPTFKVYVECEDNAGNVDHTEPLQVVGGQISVLLPQAWTQYGGISTLRLVAEEEDGVVAYSVEGYARFSSRQNASKKVDGLMKGRLAQMEAEMREAVADATSAAETAVVAKDSAVSAAQSASISREGAQHFATSAAESSATAVAAQEAAQKAAEEAAESAAKGGCGLTKAQVDAIYGLFKAAAYTKDVSAEHGAFLKAFADVPDAPGAPDVPVITATYNPKVPYNNTINLAFDTDDVESIRDWLTVTDEDGNTITEYTLFNGSDGDVTVSYNGAATTVNVPRNTITLVDGDYFTGTTSGKYEAKNEGVPYSGTIYTKLVNKWFIKTKPNYKYTAVVVLAPAYYEGNEGRTKPTINLEFINETAMSAVVTNGDYLDADVDWTNYQNLDGNDSFTYTPSVVYNGTDGAKGLKVVLNGHAGTLTSEQVASITITATPVA